MKLHRNSQKRIYIKDACYFLTTKTHNNFPYFQERIFCDLFIENLRLCKELKGYLLFGWVLLHDHFHLLVQPNDDFNISKIMKSLKENISCAINRVMYIPIEDGTTSSRLRVIYHDKYNIEFYRSEFNKKYLGQNPFPKFQWQSSFHDHYIRNQNDFDYHLKYIEYNPIKHGLSDDWPYVFANDEYCYLIDG